MTDPRLLYMMPEEASLGVESLPRISPQAIA
jgi:hypothetical protein